MVGKVGPEQTIGGGPSDTLTTVGDIEEVKWRDAIGTFMFLISRAVSRVKRPDL